MNIWLSSFLIYFINVKNVAVAEIIIKSHLIVPVLLFQTTNRLITATRSWKVQNPKKRYACAYNSNF